MEYITKYCKCGCGNGVLLKFDKDDEDLSLQLVSDNFYAYQKCKFLEKLKRIWYIIIGKEYCYFDLLMDKEETKEFKDFVDKMQPKYNKEMTGMEFCNELIRRLNNNANRYVGGTCDGHFYPEAELFEVDEIYEMIGRVRDGIPEDDGSID